MFQGPSLLSLRLFGLIAYMLLMLAAVRPLSRLIVKRLRPDVLSAELLGMTLVTVLLSAAATDAIGVHPPFGDFLAGAWQLPFCPKWERPLWQRVL
jgi:Kef-type K+ transport system membrane component KefB